LLHLRAGDARVGLGVELAERDLLAEDAALGVDLLDRQDDAVAEIAARHRDAAGDLAHVGQLHLGCRGGAGEHHERRQREPETQVTHHSLPGHCWGRLWLRRNRVPSARRSRIQTERGLPISPWAHSRLARSHFAASAAASWVLWRKSISASSGSPAVRRASNGRRNSPKSLLKNACAGRTGAAAKPSGAG